MMKGYRILKDEIVNLIDNQEGTLVNLKTL